MTTLEIEFNNARQRILRGEQLTLDEQRKLVEIIRANRFTAAEASAASKTRKSTAAGAAGAAGISDADLDAQLGDLGI